MINGAVSSLSVDQQMQNQTKREGTVLKIECEITGNPKPIYNWFKDDVLIASANVVKHDNFTHRLKLQDVPFGGKLRLEPILNTDAGWYKCVAENTNGARETSAHVEVNPDPLFRERYLQKQQREKNNPNAAMKNTGMSARIKSTANMRPVMPSSIIDESVGDVLSQMGGSVLDSQSSPFGSSSSSSSSSSRLGDSLFFSPPRDDQQPVEALMTSQMGQCEPYTGSICRDTLHGRSGAHVFVSSRTTQDQVERMLEAILSEINSQSGVVSQDCAPYIAPMLCYHHLPPCADQHETQAQNQGDSDSQVALRFQRRSQSTTRYLPMEICQEDCVAVQTRHCRAEYAKMWSQQQQYGPDQYNKRQRSMMLIGDRPLVPDCSILQRSTQPKLDDGYVGCVRFRPEDNSEMSRPELAKTRIVLLSGQPGGEEARESSDCFSGNGFSYQGTAKKTKSGKTCASWASTDYAHVVGDNGQHNHCRNPAGDLPGPWCYTAPPFQRELCDLPQCSHHRSANEIATRLFGNANTVHHQPPAYQNNNPSTSSPSSLLPSQHHPVTLSTPLTFGSLPVFLPIVAVPVLFCLIALFLICLCRNRLAKRCRRQRRCRSNSNGSASKMAAIEQERSASSTHYYPGGFRSNASPGTALFNQHSNNFLVYGQHGSPMCSNTSNGLQFGNQQVEAKVSQSLLHGAKQSIQMPTYPLAALRFFEQLSDSPIARVFRGEISSAFSENGMPSSVIVKMLRSTEQTPASFNTEVELLAGLQHPNVAHLVGVCFGPRPWCLMFECMSTDSLRQFLVNSIRQPYTSDDAEMYDDMPMSPFLRQNNQQLASSSLEHSDLIYIAIQIASALEYMTEKQQLVHRELSSYTVHIGDHLLAKVLPFSASRSGSAAAAVLPPSVVHGANSGPIASRGRLSSLSSSATPAPDNVSTLSPHCGRVAWLAPETILYGIQSSESDRWAYGIILWELFAFGLEPYSKASQMPGVDDRRVAELILGRSLPQRPTAASGLIPEGSADCPQFVYELMLECWDEIPSRRPTFTEIHARLLQWQSEGLFKLRPASSAAIMTGTNQLLSMGYDATFPMPPMPCRGSASQQSTSAASSASSGHQAGDAASASTHHTITSVGSSDQGGSNGGSNQPTNRAAVMAPPVPPPHFTRANNNNNEDFENSYAADVYCGGVPNNGDVVNNAMYEHCHNGEEDELLKVPGVGRNEAIFTFAEPLHRQQLRRPSATNSPLLTSKQPHHSASSFSTTVGGQQFLAGNTGKRRIMVLATESEVQTVAGRIGQTTAM